MHCSDGVIYCHHLISRENTSAGGEHAVTILEVGMKYVCLILGNLLAEITHGYMVFLLLLEVSYEYKKTFA